MGKGQHDVYIVNRDQTQKELFSDHKNRKLYGVNCQRGCLSFAMYKLCDLGPVI